MTCEMEEKRGFRRKTRRKKCITKPKSNEGIVFKKKVVCQKKVVKNARPINKVGPQPKIKVQSKSRDPLLEYKTQFKHFQNYVKHKMQRALLSQEILLEDADRIKKGLHAILSKEEKEMYEFIDSFCPQTKFKVRNQTNGYLRDVYSLSEALNKSKKGNVTNANRKQTATSSTQTVMTVFINEARESLRMLFENDGIERLVPSSPDEKETPTSNKMLSHVDVPSRIPIPSNPKNGNRKLSTITRKEGYTSTTFPKLIKMGPPASKRTEYPIKPLTNKNKVLPDKRRVNTDNKGIHVLGKMENKKCKEYDSANNETLETNPELDWQNGINQLSMVIVKKEKAEVGGGSTLKEVKDVLKKRDVAKKKAKVAVVPMGKSTSAKEPKKKVPVFK